jgi:hypothetical protein
MRCWNEEEEEEVNLDGKVVTLPRMSLRYTETTKFEKKIEI